MKDLDYIEIGRKIKKCREDLGISQERAAEMCSISPSFYSNIERGVKIMSLETFAAVCNAFSISADFLLNDELPKTDEVILNTLAMVKKNGTAQYEKYIKAITALALVSDKL